MAHQSDDQSILIKKFISTVDSSTHFLMPIDQEGSSILVKSIEYCLNHRALRDYWPVMEEILDSLKVVGMFKGPVKFLILSIYCLGIYKESVHCLGLNQKNFAAVEDLLNHLYDSADHLIDSNLT